MYWVHQRTENQFLSWNATFDSCRVIGGRQVHKEPEGGYPERVLDHETVCPFHFYYHQLPHSGQIFCLLGKLPFDCVQYDLHRDRVDLASRLCARVGGDMHREDRGGGDLP